LIIGAAVAIHDRLRAFCLGMIPRVKPEGVLFGKPVSTFPDML